VINDARDVVVVLPTAQKLPQGVVLLEGAFDLFRHGLLGRGLDIEVAGELNRRRDVEQVLDGSRADGG
jgi:hypothetical protein